MFHLLKKSKRME